MDVSGILNYLLLLCKEYTLSGLIFAKYYPREILESLDSRSFVHAKNLGIWERNSLQYADYQKLIEKKVNQLNLLFLYNPVYTIRIFEIAKFKTENLISPNSVNAKNLNSPFAKKSPLEN